MDNWSSLVEGYPNTPTPRDLIKVLTSAGLLLKEDLAPFEIDWILSNLLLEPIHLLSTMRRYSNDDTWSLATGQAFELLTSVLETNSHHLQIYIDDIIEVCMLKYAVHIKKRAIRCVQATVGRGPVESVAAVWRRITATLESGTQSATVNTAVAQLIGTVCENTPVLLSDQQEVELWRTLQNILEASKTSDLYKNGVLQGLYGLFKHFGDNLPIAELHSFYDRLSQKYIHIEQCTETCLQILSKYPQLFSLRISQDANTRALSWRLVTSHKMAADALVSLYGVVVTCENVDVIIKNELLPHTKSDSQTERNISFKIIATLLKKFNNRKLNDIREYFDKEVASACTKLEFSLALKLETCQDDKFEYDSELHHLIQQAAWCMETNNDCQTILTYVLTLYDKVAPAQRKTCIVYPILGFNSDLRKFTITYLINDCCMQLKQEVNQNSLLDKYIKIWKDILTVDEDYMKQSRIFFEEFIDYLLEILKEAELDDLQMSKENISNLLEVASQILDIKTARDYAHRYLEVLLNCVLDFNVVSTGTVNMISTLVDIADENVMFEDGSLSQELVLMLKSFYQNLNTAVTDEGLLNATCIALIRVPGSILDDSNAVLEAIHIIFSKNDVKPEILQKTLRQLEDIVLASNNNSAVLFEIISKLHKIRETNSFSGAAGSAFKRDLILFLGKYGCGYEKSIASNNSLLINDLKDKFTLNIPIGFSGEKYKINLNRLLDLAVRHEDHNLLKTLVVLISAELSNRKDDKVEEALALVLQTIPKCYEQDPNLDCLEHAMAQCYSDNAIRVFVENIMTESSPGVRKILSTLLESYMNNLTDFDKKERCVRMLADTVLMRLSRCDDTIKINAFDLIESLISILKESNSLTKEFIITLFLSLLKLNIIHTTLLNASNCLSDKIDLFDNSTLKEFAINIIQVLLTHKTKMDNIDISLTVLKVVLTKLMYSNEETFECVKQIVCETHNKDITAIIIVMYKLKTIFAFESSLSCNIVTFQDFYYISILNQYIESIPAIKTAEEQLNLSILYEVMGGLSEALLEVKYKLTLELLAKLISKTDIKDMKKVFKNMSYCVKKYMDILKTTPQILREAYENWFKNLPIPKITKDLQQKHIDINTSIVLYAMKKMLEVINATEIITVHINEIKKWPKILLELYRVGHIEESLKLEMSVLTDMLTVTFYFFSRTEAKGFLLECQNLTHGDINVNIGLGFLRCFISAVAKYFIENQDVLLDIDLEKSNVIILDIVRHYSRRNIDEDTSVKLSNLLNNIWPSLEKRDNNFLLQLLQILSNTTFTMFLSSNPGQWCLNTLTIPEFSTKTMKILPIFIKDVPESLKPQFKLSLTKYAATLPNLLQELSDSHPLALKALLDSFTATSNVELMELIACLARDPTKGWWDKAFENSMANVVKNDEILLHLYENCKDIIVFERLLVPMLRNCPILICENFFAVSLKAGISSLWTKPRVVNNASYLNKYTKAFIIISLAFEVLPIELLQSPNSKICKDVVLRQSQKISQEVSKLCYELKSRSDLQCPVDAEESVKEIYRTLHCYNFICFANVLIKTKAKSELFKHLFKNVWRNIIDDENIFIYIETQNKRTIKSVATNEPVNFTYTFTCQRTLFLKRTLSDNPLKYDFTEEIKEEGNQLGSVVIEDNRLNQHPCMPILMECVKELSKSGEEVLKELFEEISGGDYGVNVRWFLAQCLINCSDELKSQSDILTPILAQLVATTPYENSGLKLLNGLHINILNTISSWSENKVKIPIDSTHIQTNVHRLIETSVFHKRRYRVQKTVMKTLNDFTKIYGDEVEIPWDVFEGYLTDISNEAICLELLLTLTKNHVLINGMVKALLNRFENKKFLSNKLANMAELLGLGMACRQQGIDNLSRLHRMLDKLRLSNNQEYVKVLFYVQNGYKGCVDEMQFRHIADLTSKMVREQKSKCIDILTNYLSTRSESNDYIQTMFESIDICESLYGDSTSLVLRLVATSFGLMKDDFKKRVLSVIFDITESPVVKIRKMAYETLLKASRDLSEYTAKSSKLMKFMTSSLLRSFDDEDGFRRTMLSCLAAGLVDDDDEIAAMVMKVVWERLSGDDLQMRFTECLIVSLCLPYLKSGRVKSSNDKATRSLYVMLRLFFGDEDKLAPLRKVRIREESEMSVSKASSSKLTTLTRSLHGTLRSKMTMSHSRGGKIKNIGKEISSNEPQKTMFDVLESMMNFAKNNYEAGFEMVKEILTSLRKGSQRGILCDDYIPKWLLNILNTKWRNNITPAILGMCRLLIDECCLVSGFEDTIANLKSLTIGSNGENIIAALYEDVVMRKMKYNAVSFQAEMDYNVDMYEESESFSIQELSDCFDKLSNWEDLTLKQRRLIEHSGLPMLWVNEETFRDSLTEYCDNNNWFSKMAVALKSDAPMASQHYKWLEELDVWPGFEFETSAVTEAIEWDSLTDASLLKLPINIRHNDCLAKWAARLMIRSSYLKKNSSNEDEDSLNRLSKLSRSQELLWCSEANTRQLPRLVLQCADRNTSDLHSSEALPWLHQQVEALKCLGLRNNCEETLRKALVKAETFTPRFADSSSPDVVIAMYSNVLYLRQALHDNSINNINNVLAQLNNTRTSISEENTVSYLSCQRLKQSYEVAILYLDQTLSNIEDKNQKQEIFKNMLIHFNNFIGLNMSTKYCEGILSVILNRLFDENDLYNNYIGEFLDKINENIDHLNDGITEALIKLLKKIPKTTLRKYATLFSKTTESFGEKFRLCLQLICDPEHALVQYVEKLADSLKNKDGAGWTSCFSMMSEWFDNNYVGASYKLIEKHVLRLRELSSYEPSDAFSCKSTKILKEIHSILTKDNSKTLNLSDLCPALTQSNLYENERDGDSLAKLLMLPAGVRVERFEKQITVLNSLRRPCLLSLLLTNGTRSKVLIKRGECLYADHVVSTIIPCLNTTRYKVKNYQVIPLSQDCGIIQYLEDHVTVRSMINSKYNLDEILLSAQRGKDEELILSPSSQLSRFEELRSKIPVYAFRSLIEADSSFFEEFYNKRSSAINSLAAMTVCTWVLGTSDRHLENILYGRDGSLCAVDRHVGIAPGLELPPARCGGLLVGSRDVLTSRIETVLSSLRDTCQILSSTVKLLLRNYPGLTDEVFEKKVQTIQNILEGKVLSYQISIDLLEESQMAYKQNYIDLLNDIFGDFEQKDMYSVEEQVSVVLQQCSDKRILSVTRSGWEPWV